MTARGRRTVLLITILAPGGYESPFTGRNSAHLVADAAVAAPALTLGDPSPASAIHPKDRPPFCPPGDPLCNGMLDPVVRSGPKGAVFMGPAKVSTGRVANADRVVAGMRSAFRACYNAGLLSDPFQSAKVHVVITLTDQGAVANARTEGAEGLDSATTRCIIHRVEQASFAPPEPAGKEVSFEVTLQPADDH